MNCNPMRNIVEVDQRDEEGFKIQGLHSLILLDIFVSCGTAAISESNTNIVQETLKKTQSIGN